MARHATRTQTLYASFTMSAISTRELIPAPPVSIILAPFFLQRDTGTRDRLTTRRRKRCLMNARAWLNRK